MKARDLPDRFIVNEDIDISSIACSHEDDEDVTELHRGEVFYKSLNFSATVVYMKQISIRIPTNHHIKSFQLENKVLEEVLKWVKEEIIIPF